MIAQHTAAFTIFCELVFEDVILLCTVTSNSDVILRKSEIFSTAANARLIANVVHLVIMI